MESQHNTTNTKEFEVTGISRSGRVRKKSSKLLDFQSPDDVEKKVYKRTTSSPKTTTVRHSGRGRPSLAAMRARKITQSVPEEEEDSATDEEELDKDANDKNMDIDQPLKETDESIEDDVDISDVFHNASGLTATSDTDDDGFGELVADLVGTETANLDGSAANHKSSYRQSIYMTEKNKKFKENRAERKDKGKARFTAYNMWAREHRKSTKFSQTNDMDHQAARRLHELWSNVSNKEKNAWKRKAKMQATRAKQKEKSGLINANKSSTLTTRQSVDHINQNSTFINRPTTSRTRKLAEDKQKAKEEMAIAKTSQTTITPKKARNNSYRRNQNTSINNSNNNNLINDNSTSPLFKATNGTTNSYKSSKTSTSLNNLKTPLPTIEPIDAAAHLKLLGESLSIIGDRLKEHEGQIAVSGSLSVLLDSLLCSLGPLLCLTTRLPGLDKKQQLKANLATTLDNIAYVMPGL